MGINEATLSIPRKCHYRHLVVSLILGSLSNDDGNENENATKQ